jgi:hypothetical protein
MLKFKFRTLAQLSIACLLAVVLSAGSIARTASGSAPQKMTAEEVIAKHLEAIGTAEARAKIKSHIILGTALGTIRIGGSGSSQGGSVMASQGTRSLVAIIYGNKEFPYEKLGFDGKTVSVGDLKPGIHSTLGNFFMQHEFPIREGLLAGTLSAAWPLLDLSQRDAKVKYAGTKKLDDRKVYVLEYTGGNNAGLKTSLFFDAETFRHVRTEYEKKQIQQMPTGPSITQQQGDAITKLVEEFSDFKAEGGLTFPHTYKLQLSIETLNRRALQDWVFTLTQFSFNRDIDPSEFDVRGTGKKS